MQTEHCTQAVISAMEGQRVALMNLGTLDYGHRWPEKRKLSTWVGTSKKILPMRFDENHLNPASVRLIWVQLFVLYLGVATD